MALKLGAQSYFCKDFIPMVDRIFIRQSSAAMKTQDTFIVGLRKLFDANPKLKPAPVAVAAELNNSTIRKWLSGGTNSPKVETAEKVAAALNLKLSFIVALGENAEADLDVVRLAIAISQADPDTQRRIDAYLEVQNAGLPGSQAQTQQEG